MSDWLVVTIAVVFICAVCIWAGTWVYMRRKYVDFTNAVCGSIDEILLGEGTEDFDFDDETLLSKIQMRLKRLVVFNDAAATESEEQKRQVQSIVSDIYNQLKTPIANITMYCDTALRPELSDETRQQCLETMKKQVKKLDSLIQSLLQMSRMENNIIVLHPRDNVLKNMLFEVTECGKIRIWVDPLDIYTKITIEDNGTGIAPEHINDVCKRFFREEKSSGIEGVGIGLYLTREIISKQDGYLKINSEEGKGTSVSVYLPNQGK